jgi:ankyrin repeat protein
MRLARFAVVLLTLSVLALPAVAAKSKKPNREATEALLAAAAESEGDAILQALEQGADPLAKDEDGNTALILAVMDNLWGNQEKVIDALLKAKVPIDAKNKSGMTALALAAREGEDENVKALIAKGADVNAREEDGWTPLMLAAYNGQTSAVDALLAAKADFKIKSTDGIWDALILALAEGRGGAAEKLVQAGAVIPTGPVNDLTPLIHATFGGDLQSVRLVLATKPDLTVRDADGWSALEIAAYNGYPQIAMELLRAGIDPTLKDKEGKTALDKAIENENSEIVAMLGGPWEKPKNAGTKVTVPCPALGGNVEAAFEVREDDLVVSTFYPKPLSWYLGGGMTNRAASAVKLTYDGSAAPVYHFDTDANRKTGRKADPLEKGVEGTEHSLEYTEYGTTVTLSYRNSEDEVVEKPVYANVLSATLTKMGETWDTGVPEDYTPDASNNNGVLETSMPLSVFGLQKGKKVRVVVAIGACELKEATVKL